MRRKTVSDASRVEPRGVLPLVVTHPVHGEKAKNLGSGHVLIADRATYRPATYHDAQSPTPHRRACLQGSCRLRAVKPIPRNGNRLPPRRPAIEFVQGLVVGHYRVDEPRPTGSGGTCTAP